MWLDQLPKNKDRRVEDHQRGWKSHIGSHAIVGEKFDDGIGLSKDYRLALVHAVGACSHMSSQDFVLGGLVPDHTCNRPEESGMLSRNGLMLHIKVLESCTKKKTLQPILHSIW